MFQFPSILCVIQHFTFSQFLKSVKSVSGCFQIHGLCTRRPNLSAAYVLVSWSVAPQTGLRTKIILKASLISTQLMEWWNSPNSACATLEAFQIRRVFRLRPTNLWIWTQPVFLQSVCHSYLLSVSNQLTCLQYLINLCSTYRASPWHRIIPGHSSLWR